MEQEVGVPLRVVQEPWKGEIEIEGLMFSYEFFRFFSNEANVGRTFRFAKLEGGVITVTVVP